MKTLIAITTALLLLAACSGKPVTEPVDLQGRWIISDMVHVSSLAQHTPWLFFSAQKISGHTGCNNLAGAYQLDNNILQIDQLASTRKFCMGPEMEQERALLKLLSFPLYARREGNQLLLSLEKETQPVLVLQKDNMP